MKEVSVDMPLTELVQICPQKPAKDPGTMVYTGPPARNGQPTAATDAERLHEKQRWAWDANVILEAHAQAIADRIAKDLVEKLSR